MYSLVGKLWNNREIGIISDGKNYFALYNWDGYAWIDCWHVLDKQGLNRSEDNTTYRVYPVYEEVEDGYNIVDYDVEEAS